MTLACLHCGGPITAIRGGRYCMQADCRRAYQREYEANQRKRPERVTRGVAQPGLPDLPPLGEILYDADGARLQCHACGRWLATLGGHARSHGLTLDQYRELYELPRGQSLAAPQLAERLRDRAVSQGLGEMGRQNLAGIPTPGRPRGTPARLGERIGKSRAGRKSS